MKKIISERGNFVAVLAVDEYAENPREMHDTTGTIFFASERYILGDKEASGEEICATCKRKDVIYLPVYALVHSGIWLSTTSFHDPWDSWQSGIIYAEKEDLRKLFGVKHLTQKHIREAQKILEDEVKEFSDYLSGNVYQYQIFRVAEDVYPEDIEGHSCAEWGVIGTYCNIFGYENAEADATLKLAEAEKKLSAQPTQLTLPGLPTNRRGHVLPYGGSHASA